APDASEGMVHGSAEQPPPLTFVIVRPTGVSVTTTFVAVLGPALATSSENWIESWFRNGPVLMNALTIETSADAPAVPPLPLLSVLFAVFESDSAGVAVALLSNAPAAMMVASTLMVVFAPAARLPMVQGSDAQPEPETLVMLRFDGESVTWMFVAVD